MNAFLVCLAISSVFSVDPMVRNGESGAEEAVVSQDFEDISSDAGLSMATEMHDMESGVVIATTSGSGPCCSTCNTCRQQGLVAGVGFYLLQPFYSNNPAITIFTQSTGPSRREDIKQHVGAAPIVWFGYQGESGLGGRVRYWTFRQGTDATYQFENSGSLAVLSASALGAALFQASPQEFAITSKLQLNVADFEVYDDFKLGKYDLQLCGGFSYVDIGHNYNAYAIGAGGNQAVPLHSDSGYYGLGPVLALELRRSIGCSGLSVYGNTRSRVVFGENSQVVSGGGELTGTIESTQYSLVAIQELEIGLQYTRQMGRIRWFGQAALVGQEWFGGGNATGTTRTSPQTGIGNFGNEETTHFGLLGGSFRFGFGY